MMAVEVQDPHVVNLLKIINDVIVTDAIEAFTSINRNFKRDEFLISFTGIMPERHRRRTLPLPFPC